MKISFTLFVLTFLVVTTSAWAQSSNPIKVIVGARSGSFNYEVGIETLRDNKLSEDEVELLAVIGNLRQKDACTYTYFDTYQKVLQSSEFQQLLKRYLSIRDIRPVALKIKVDIEIAEIQLDYISEKSPQFNGQSVPVTRTLAQYRNDNKCKTNAPTVSSVIANDVKPAMEFTLSHQQILDQLRNLNATYPLTGELNPVQVVNQNRESQILFEYGSGPSVAGTNSGTAH